ncbi:MAG: hypothetical protein MJ077_05280, partial [Oscillospiraceae bacterium]|nr:hypothetical protein [Oscillospiraceae bacterium]
SWYAMQPRGSAPAFDPGTDSGAVSYNKAEFRSFMPGFASEISSVDGSNRMDGRLEVRHPDGSGTAFYDSAVYHAPRGNSSVYEDKNGHQWYAIQGTPSVERRPVYENGKPVYENGKLKTTSIASIRYGSTPQQFTAPQTACRYQH